MQCSILAEVREHNQKPTQKLNDVHRATMCILNNAHIISSVHSEYMRISHELHQKIPWEYE